ncbi:MAG: hypothetical protein WCO25_03835 [Candidatus Uhrbacteria bacterium]
MKKALLVLSALLFVGAGCTSTASTTVTAPAVTPTTVKTTTVAPSTAKTTAPAAADVTTSVQIVPSKTK